MANTKKKNKKKKKSFFSLDNIKKLLINNKLTIWIIINIIYIFFGTYCYSTNYYTQYDYMIGFIPFIVVNVVIGLVSYFKSEKKNKIYIVLLLIVIMGLISTIFAVKPEVAIYGFENRHEGFIAILYYLSLFFASSFIKDKKSKKIVVYTILLSGAIQTVYAILQVFEIPSANPIYHYKYIANGKKVDAIKEIWATGFLLNPNFYGSFALICLCYSIGLYIDDPEEKDSTLLLVFRYLTICLFSLGLFISNTVSCVLALFIVMALLLIYCIKHKKIGKYIVTSIIIIFVLVSTVLNDKTTILEDLHITGNEVKEISKGNVQDYYGTRRIYIWRKTLEEVPKHLLHGVGIDNFYYAFDGKPLISYKKTNSYDKAHNDYLQILITQGLIALILYLIFFTKIVIDGIKSKETLFVLPIIGYLIQAFFNISIIGVAPIFYIALGLCLERKQE